ncbi:hypothetical protein L0991_03625 [Vibrio chagasii]|uniref:hypothetical protein n=1 Tax=Vibrio chagasii TaxID=170679 RepID=UPI0035A718D7
MKKIVIGTVLTICCLVAASTVIEIHSELIVLKACVFEKKVHLDQSYNAIADNYQGISSPVLRNRLDKNYNRQVAEYNEFLMLGRAEQIKECKQNS